MGVMNNNPDISEPNTLTIDDLIKLADMVNELIDNTPELDQLALDENHVGGTHTWAVDEIINGPGGCTGVNHNSRARSIVRSILIKNHDILTNANYDI